MKKLVLLILFLVFVLAGCSTVKTQGPNSQETSLQKQSLEPKQVVENYFKYKNEKNKEALLTTVTEWQKSPNMDLGFENLKYIKINSI